MYEFKDLSLNHIVWSWRGRHLACSDWLELLREVFTSLFLKFELSFMFDLLFIEVWKSVAISKCDQGSDYS